MEQYLKILGLVLAGSVCVLMLRDGAWRQLVSLAVIALAGRLLLELLQPVLELVTRLAALSQMESAVFYPVLKASCIGLLTQITGSICADAGEKALEQLIAAAGSLAVLYVSLPLFSAVLDLLQTMMGG